jgi:5-methylcytosine-specific restriction endonuclease McrA
MKKGSSKYTKQLLTKLVNKHNNVADIVRELGLRVGGGSHNLICKRIKECGINTSHFKKRGWSSTKANVTNEHTVETFKKYVLCKNGLGWKSHRIKEKLYKFKLKKEECEKCGQSNIWNKNKLVLHLHHLNEDHTDNRLENLQILCPNCHSQTRAVNP